MVNGFPLDGVSGAVCVAVLQDEPDCGVWEALFYKTNLAFCKTSLAERRQVGLRGLNWVRLFYKTNCAARQGSQFRDAG
jgi:hypothetical protein